VREQLWMFSQFYGLGVREGWRRVDERIDLVALGEQRGQEVATLSTGQRRRLAVATVLVRASRLWLLDEPHAGLDATGRNLLDALIAEAAAEGTTVLIASHEPDRASALADRTVTLAGGRVVGESTRCSEPPPAAPPAAAATPAAAAVPGESLHVA
jgi:ABC-type multidrug transport system ATPase subunit